MNPLEILDNPHMTHAATVQFPIALGILGMPLVLLGAIVKMQWTQFRWVMVVWYLLLAGTGFLAVLTGEMVLAVLPVNITPDLRDMVSLHAQLAEILWILAVGAAILILLCGIKTDWFRATCSMLAVLVSLAAGAWSIFTGYYGISMVHEHGLGTPDKASIAAPAQVHPVQAPPEPVTPPPAPPFPSSVPAPEDLDPLQEPSQPESHSPSDKPPGAPPAPNTGATSSVHTVPGAPTPRLKLGLGSPPQKDAAQLLKEDPEMLRNKQEQESYTTRLMNFFTEVKKYIWP